MCGHLLTPVVGIIVSCYALRSNGHMGECLMRAVITHRFSTFIALLQWLADLLSVTLLFIWKPCCLSFPNSKNICFLPHQHDTFFTVCQSWVGLDIILCALNIVYVFANPKGFDSFSPGKCHCATFCTHWRALSKYDAWWIKKTSKRSDALQQGPLE